MKELKPLHKQFALEYLKNGFNGTQAYLAIRPKVSYQTAKVNAARLLTYASVKEELERIQNKRESKSLASREQLIEEAHRIGGKAENDKAYGAALKATELKGRLNRLFDADTPDLANYQALIQSLTINVTPGQQDKDTDQQDDAIDIGFTEVKELKD